MDTYVCMFTRLGYNNIAHIFLGGMLVCINIKLIYFFMG